jgi:hypothetical protein
MTKSNLFFLGFFSLLLGACSGDKQVNEANGLPVVSLSEDILGTPDQILSEVDFIPLKIPVGTPVSLMGFDPKMAFGSKSFYLNTDPYMNPRIHEFDYSGNLIQTIDRKGGGPQEFESIDDMGISTEGNLVVYSRSELLAFDQDMNISKRIAVRPEDGFYSVWDFEALSGPEWLLGIAGGQHQEEKRGNFAVFNEDTQEFNFLPVYAYPATGIAEEANIAAYKEGFVFNFALTDTLFYYDGSAISPLVTLDYGKRAMPMDMRMKDEDTMDEEMQRLFVTQTYDLNIGMIKSAGNTIGTVIFGIKPAPFDMEEVERTGEEPVDFPTYEVYIQPETGKAKGTKIMPGIGGEFLSDGKYFYRLLYTEIWHYFLESGSLGSEWTKALQEAVEQLEDEEDPILMRYQVDW